MKGSSTSPTILSDVYRTLIGKSYTVGLAQTSYIFISPPILGLNENMTSPFGCPFSLFRMRSSSLSNSIQLIEPHASGYFFFTASTNK